MVLRWYSVVIDGRDGRAQASWWAGVVAGKTIDEADDEGKSSDVGARGVVG